MVHGADHGAWCWYKLIPILKSQGHTVTAVDLAASGSDLRVAETLLSFAEYIGTLTGLMESLSEDEKVILVAHSLDGLAISEAMEINHDKDVELAVLLGRPLRLLSNVEIDTRLVITLERFGSVNRIFVVSEKDKSLVKDFQLWMIKNNPPNHVEYIQNSDQMVMISRPLDLGACLLSLAEKFA